MKHAKWLFTVAVLLQTVLLSIAQPPEKMSYQAVIRNSSNQLVVNQVVGMRISVLQGTADGTVVYTETQTPTTNANGLVSIEIGNGTGFNTIEWANGPYFIKTETDPAGSTNYTISGTSQILSVPYALHAKTADNISNFNALEIKGIGLPYTFGPDIGYVGTEGGYIGFGHDGVSEDFIGYKNNTFFFKDSPEGGDNTDPNVVVGGKLGVGIEILDDMLEVDGDIDVHNNTVKNLADPVNPQDAATKAYVDGTANFSGDYNDLSNKPGNATSTNDGFMGSADKAKLDGITTGAEVNVQADWNQTTNSADDYIKNKPIIPAAQIQTNWTATSGMGVLLDKPANIDEDKTDDVTLTGNQTIAGNKTLSGTTVFIGTTIVPSPVNANDAANKAYVDALLARIEALELANGFTDPRDGNHYKVIKISNQIWMAENLKYLPSVVGPATGSETDPYYYVYGYDGTVVADAKATSNYATYGVLYNWPAAMAGGTSSNANPSGVQGVCPTGWHLPSDAEWTQLTDYLGGTSVAGGKLKEIGTTHWLSPNTEATNETGFTAFPGGYRGINHGAFYGIGYNGYWWSATEALTAYAFYLVVYYYYSYVNLYNNGKTGAFSVRCVRD